MHQPPAPEPAANQDAPINKDSKSPNPRSLRQHTLAEPIPPCCFRFCLVLRNRPFHRTNNQVSPRIRSSFSWPSHIYSAPALQLSFSCLRIYVSTSTASALGLPASTTACHGTYASANGSLRNADRSGGMG